MSIFYGDFETTGLDPSQDFPLEWGMLVTLGGLFERRGFEFLFKYPLEVLHDLKQHASPKVVEMHDGSGLWQDLFSVANGTYSGEAMVTDLESFDSHLNVIADQCSLDGLELAGFGPHFDQRWLRAYAPRFCARLSYRLRDIRTLAREVQDHYETDWGPDAFGPHRALADCRAAHKYHQWFRRHVMSLYGSPAGGHD
jgi:oligoribonuclease (3'-5' exoribonuclease)